MLDVLADFEWYREPKGHRIVAFGSLTQGAPWKRSSAHDDVPWITPNGRADDVRKYKPFARGADLCAAFVAVRTPQALLRFVNDHGLLTWGGVPVSRYK